MSPRLDFPALYREQVRRKGKRKTLVRRVETVLRGCEVPAIGALPVFDVVGGPAAGRYVRHEGRFMSEASPGGLAWHRLVAGGHVNRAIDPGEVAVVDDDLDDVSERLRGSLSRDCVLVGGVPFAPAPEPCWGVSVDALRCKVDLLVVAVGEWSPALALLPLSRESEAVRVAAAVASTLGCSPTRSSTLSGALPPYDSLCPPLDEQARIVRERAGGRCADAADALFRIAARL